MSTKTETKTKIALETKTKSKLKLTLQDEIKTKTKILRLKHQYQPELVYLLLSSTVPFIDFVLVLLNMPAVQLWYFSALCPSVSRCGQNWPTTIDNRILIYLDIRLPINQPFKMLPPEVESARNFDLNIA